MSKILIIEDDRDIADLISIHMKDNGHEAEMMHDAGTEINELPGVGLHQPARLNGGEDENGNVMIVNDAFTYPAVADIVKITITPM